MSEPAGKLGGRQAVALAVGVVGLEFAAAVTSLVAGTLMPVVERDLGAERVLPLCELGPEILKSASRSAVPA